LLLLLLLLLLLFFFFFFNVLVRCHTCAKDARLRRAWESRV